MTLLEFKQNILPLIYWILSSRKTKSHRLR